MAVSFTPEQRQAIELHNRDILVSAAAGSGKTAVLSERIVEMVCRDENPVDIDRLLVVTFTNAAAAEMRERISREILNRLNEDGENDHLQRQAALLHNAQITTIDSFCLFVLRNNFQDIGLDPSFRIADTGETELLKQEVLSALLEERFASGSEDFFYCVEYFCPAGRESMLEKHVTDLARYAESYPFPREWLAARKQDYRFSSVEDIEASDWGGYLLSHLKKMAESMAEEMRAVKRLCEEPDGPYMYGETAEREEEMLEGLTKADSLRKYEAALSGITFDRLPSKKDDSVLPEKRERAKEIRDGVKGTVKDLEAKYFSMPLETAVRQAPACARAVDALIDLCLDFLDGLDEKKREKKILDFSDIEHFALQILLEKGEDGSVSPSRTALEYREYFEEVLIDEYQDSNLVQEYLLWAVAREKEGAKNRFMVGDVKQSIYKFRLARPEIFLAKYHGFSDGRPGCRRIDLHRNFRSRTEVIDTVNEVFSKIMTPGLGGIEYDESAALFAGASYPENEGCESELLLFEKPKKESESGGREAEAAGIAGKIKALRRSFQVTDKATGVLRPVQYRDMVILLRTGSGWDEEFKDVLEREGIPVHLEGRTGYFASKEIQDVLQFLRVLDNPLQDIPMFGVMKSVFGGFTEEEEALVRTFGGERSDPLYRSVRHIADGGADEPLLTEELVQKCAGFLARIGRLRECTAYMPIGELLKTIFDEYGYLPYVAALPSGEKRLANVEMLLAKAAVFEKNSYYGLFHFVRYIEQLEKYNVDYGEANTMGENADVVRIMSIHKSKGLEFPVVFVAGLAKKFNMQDAAQAMIADVDMGIGVHYMNPEQRVKNKTLRGNVLSLKLKADTLAEELRILYVAMTRAKEKLIMTACVPAEKCAAAEADRAARGEKKSRGALPYGRLVTAGSFLDYLLPVFDNVKTVPESELFVGKTAEEVSGELRKRRFFAAAGETDEEAKRLLAERFSYEYPHGDLARLYTKTTVSELKKAAMQGDGEEPAGELFPVKEVQPYIPTFRREKEEVSGAARGSAMHRVMELLDLGREYGNESDIRSAVENFKAEGMLTGEYADAVRTDRILRFLRTPLARRMGRAAEEGRLFREQPFVYGIDAGRLSSGKDVFPAGEIVLIQGIIDAFFEEDGEIVLVDYKTDVIGTPGELAERYRTQLDYYEEALFGLTGKKVKEKLLYSFFLECEVPC